MINLYILDSLNCSVSTFDAECLTLNRTYGKNNTASEIKSNHYIISFDPKDSVEGSLSIQDAQRIGMDYAKRNFPGHQTLICTHADGEEHSGNIHVHMSEIMLYEAARGWLKNLMTTIPPIGF